MYVFPSMYTVSCSRAMFTRLEGQAAALFWAATRSAATLGGFMDRREEEKPVRASLAFWLSLLTYSPLVRPCEILMSRVSIITTHDLSTMSLTRVTSLQSRS